MSAGVSWCVQRAGGYAVGATFAAGGAIGVYQGAIAFQQEARRPRYYGEGPVNVAFHSMAPFVANVIGGVILAPVVVPMKIWEVYQTTQKELRQAASLGGSGRSIRDLPTGR